MAYYEYFKRLLEPLGLYELNAGAGAEELKVIAAQLDKVYDALELLRRECLISTAQSYGLDRYTELVSKIQTGATAVSTRKTLMALLRIRQGYFTPKALVDTVGGCGLPAIVKETATANVVEVSFPTIRGVPANIESLKRRVEEILPCHLDIQYIYIYILWKDYQTMFKSWREVQSCCESWRTFQSYVPESEEET